MDKCTDATPADAEAVAEDTGDNMIAGYAPSTPVDDHAKVDLDMKEINDLVKAAKDDESKMGDALFVYENGGGGKCSEDDINGAAEQSSCYEKTTEDAKGNSVKGDGTIRTLYGFATC